jgi:hypothetical protein
MIMFSKENRMQAPSCLKAFHCLSEPFPLFRLYVFKVESYAFDSHCVLSFMARNA